ncbi:MAG: 3-oxoacid CoA-transferase subunit B [Alphaproteobacteria bacterium]|nr:3-oxoacid CoA-transferase subunit B [Alphaproteobacteria bacterium]
MSEQTNLLTRQQIAARAAQDMQDGWLVNLGIGMPTMIPAFIPSNRDVMFHSENGLIGMGPPPAEGEADQDLISAGKELVTMVSGGAYVHHTDSFAIARGGRLDCAVLGAFQVAVNGDLCNWRLPNQTSGSVGGAMDIAAGSKRVFVMMTHTARDGAAKIVAARTYPLTAMKVVTKIFTDMAVISVTPDGFVLNEVAPGLTADVVQAATDAPLNMDAVGTIDVAA